MPIRRLHPSNEKYLEKPYPMSKANSPDKGEHGGFQVSFFGSVPATAEEKERIEKIAHQQLYLETTGKDARDDLTPAQMRKEMEEHAGEPLNIKLVAISIGKHDRAGSFANHLEHIDKFVEASRGLLVKHAIKELKKLGGVESACGDASSQDKSALCYALLKLQTSDMDRSSEFFGKYQRTFEALKDNPNLKAGFRSAERRLLRDMNRDEAPMERAESSGTRPRYDRSDRRDAYGLD